MWPYVWASFRAGVSRALHDLAYTVSSQMLDKRRKVNTKTSTDCMCFMTAEERCHPTLQFDFESSFPFSRSLLLESDAPLDAPS